jgi:hypothetical protein
MVNEMEFGTYYEAIAWELRGALSRYYDKWLEILCQEEVERPLYLSTIEQKRVTVVVLTCALIEHTINFYLGTKCDTTRFEELQWKNLAQKWKNVPRLFATAYRLPGGSELARDLDAVINRRNAIMHAKPRLSIDGDNRHAGNEPAIRLDENAFIERCASLPYRLLEHLLSFDRDAFMAMCSVRTSCGAVMHGLGGARYKFDYATKLPEELVGEIMTQGHRRDRARLFAALIGPEPRRRRDGSIAVRRYGEVIAVLEPMKFFDSAGFVLDLSDPALALERRNQLQNGADEFTRDGEQAGQR